MCLCWLLIAIVSAIAEVATVAVVAIWFVLGASFAALACVAGAKLWLQITAFVLISALGVFAFHKVWKRILCPVACTNLERNIGRSVRVLEDIDNLAGTGAVKLNGQHWNARAEEDGICIPEGNCVVIERFAGSRVIVSLSPRSI